jgi:hypothetical protein
MLTGVTHLLITNIYIKTGRNKSRGIVTGYGLDERESEYSLLHIIQTGCEAARPPIQWVRGLLPWGKEVGS